MTQIPKHNEDDKKNSYRKYKHKIWKIDVDTLHKAVPHK